MLSADDPHGRVSITDMRGPAIARTNDAWIALQEGLAEEPSFVAAMLDVVAVALVTNGLVNSVCHGGCGPCK